MLMVVGFLGVSVRNIERLFREYFNVKAVRHLWPVCSVINAGLKERFNYAVDLERWKKRTVRCDAHDCLEAVFLRTLPVAVEHIVLFTIEHVHVVVWKMRVVRHGQNNPVNKPGSLNAPNYMIQN